MRRTGAADRAAPIARSFFTMASSPSLAAFRSEYRSHARATVRNRLVGLAALAAALLLSAAISDFSVGRLVEGLPRIGDFLSGMIPPLAWATLGRDFSSWFWGLGDWLTLIWSTLMIALFGTALGSVLGGIASFYAARTLGANAWVRAVTRRFLEICRTVPDLVWALIFLFSFGLGPLSGALAIMLHTLGAQGKLFADVNENADMRPLEGVRAAGGTWFDEMRIGLLPQVLPNYVSYTLWRFELNVRSATIIGFVGAGGIGMLLYESLSLGYYDDAGAILLLVFVTVSLNDMLSEWLRTRIAGGAHG